MNTGFSARLLWLGAVVVLCGHATSFSKCDVDHSGAVRVADVQQMINEASGAGQPNDDLNLDGRIDVVDIQIDINAALGLACAADPGLISIVPNSGLPGSSGLSVTISGTHTSFSNSSAVSLGSGITITNVSATNSTTLLATLSIDSNAALGKRDLTVDGLTLSNAFLVAVPASVSYTYDTQGRLATATYTSASGSAIVVTYSYDAMGNRTAVVAQ